MGLQGSSSRRNCWGESTKLLGVLNLPWQGFETKFIKIEAYAGMAERLVKDLEIEEALQTEIKETLEHNNQSYVDWCSVSYKVKKNNEVKLTVKYDMGSSGNRYDSYSEHAFIIGGSSKGIIGMVLYSKACLKCDAGETRGEELEEHECPKNFKGNSKSMEAYAILKMVEYAFYNLFFIIYAIISYNDRTMIDMLKHP